jgi:hypothetical protein
MPQLRGERTAKSWTARPRAPASLQHRRQEGARWSDDQPTLGYRQSVIVRPKSQPVIAGRKRFVDSDAVGVVRNDSFQSTAVLSLDFPAVLPAPHRHSFDRYGQCGIAIALPQDHGRQDGIIRRGLQPRDERLDGRFRYLPRFAGPVAIPDLDAERARQGLERASSRHASPFSARNQATNQPGSVLQGRPSATAGCMLRSIRLARPSR